MMEEEEDYWGASSVKKRTKKTNIFDDSVSVEAASDLAKYKKSLADSDDEDVDTVNWDDTPVTPTTSRAAPPQRQASGFSSRPRPSFEPEFAHYGAPKPFPSKPGSYMTHSRSQSEVLGVTFEKSSSSVLSIDEPPLRQGSEPSIDTIVGRSDQQRTVSKDATKLQKEVEFLTRELKRARMSGSEKLKIDDTIRRIILGQPFHLEPYRAKDEKLELLDKAIQTHDSNAILAVLMFLKQTVKEQIFNVELAKRPEAVNQYLSYLRARFLLRELETVLSMLGRNEEIAMFKYKQAVSVDDPASKIMRLKSCCSAHFQSDSQLEHEASMINKQMDLLQRQRSIEVADSMAQSEGKTPVFRDHPRAASVINMPVITTLYYCCMYHYRDPETSWPSPQSIRSKHELTEKQYVWTALRARAKLKKWQDIEELLTVKGWFGGTKLKAVIGFENVSEILHKTGAPTGVLAKFLKLIEDIERRLTLARKMKCHLAVIDTYIAQKDKRALENYTRSLDQRSQDWFYANDALRSTTIKWKS